jgi:tRNA A-37 threonylcarbamoyl transferase component Bud32
MLPAILGKDEELTDKSTDFGRYRIVRELGAGGMAQVFEARHIDLDRRVALKVMRPALAAHSLASARFLREAKAACHIRHQHVVEVFDTGTDHDLPYIVMEFLEGSNLAALLVEKGPLPISAIADIFLPVMSAVSTAHSVGIIHRDLKPANLMLVRRPPRAHHPMVLDFGISKIAHTEELENTLTRSESLLGTVQYMAPELTKSARSASAASDQYALGVMLYECATGQRPFMGSSHYELMHAIVTAPVVPPSRLRPGLPLEFDELVEKAMHRDPAKRFSSVHALGAALLSFGDRAAWALWDGEFIGTARDVDPWNKDGGTVDDATGRQRSGVRATPSTLSIALRNRPARAVIVPLAIYAVAVSAIAARRTFETSRGEASAEVASLAIAARTGMSSLMPQAPRPSDELSVDGVRIPSDERAVASESANQSKSTGESVPLRMGVELKAGSEKSAAMRQEPQAEPLARKAQLGTSVRSAKPAASAPTVAAAPTTPSPFVHEGTNGAPIVE